MRLVTWNIGRRKSKHEAAWHYLLLHLKADVTCVQEALGSADRLVAGTGSITWSKARPGGTGVFVRRGVKFSQAPSLVKGSYVAGVSLLLTAGSLRVFSVHVGPESWSNQKALEPWLVDQVQAEPTIVGGDFNISRAYSARHKAYFERLAGSGVLDCHWSNNGREVPTFWGRQSLGVKYQNDHFFTSPRLGSSVRACWVDDNPVTRLLSDHGPVVLDLKDHAT